jgi:predicted PurR-regulated permease PerM
MISYFAGAIVTVFMIYVFNKIAVKFEMITIPLDVALSVSVFSWLSVFALIAVFTVGAIWAFIKEFVSVMDTGWFEGKDDEKVYRR